MTKITIERHSVLLFVSVFATVATVVSGIIALLLTEFSIMVTVSLFGFFILLSIALPYTRSKKEMLIIDDEGLTLNSNIMLGPIPWDCISGASILRIGFDKILSIHVKNNPNWRVSSEKMPYAKR
ncbi:MAG: hypothetical protein LBJ20_08305 [Candidatus Methanoplasma sp.]|jgi:hypothetical protein|nr:hypothetical protein [Candidatus Methanoplasma sp.]